MRPEGVPGLRSWRPQRQVGVLCNAFYLKGSGKNRTPHQAESEGRAEEHVPHREADGIREPCSERDGLVRGSSNAASHGRPCSPLPSSSFTQNRLEATSSGTARVPKSIEFRTFVSHGKSDLKTGANGESSRPGRLTSDTRRSMHARTKV